MLLELGLSLDFSLSFLCSLLLQVLIPQGCIPFHLENSQFESLFIIVLLKLKGPFNNLYSIKVILWFEVTIKFECLNLEVAKVIYWIPSSFNTPMFIIFMRIWIGNANEVDIKLLMVSGSAFGSFDLLKLNGEFSYLMLRSDNDIHPHFMDLLTWYASRLRRFSFISHCWKWSRVKWGLRVQKKGGMGHAGRDTHIKKGEAWAC